MAECTNCGTTHGTESFEIDGVVRTYCLGCVPEEAEELEDVDGLCIGYPDMR